MTPQDLVEIELIKRVKYRYLRSLDTADHAELARLFTDDVTAHYRGGSYDARLNGAAELLEYLASSASADVVIMHHCHHPEIDLTGPDAAVGLWYLEDSYFNHRQKRRVGGTAFYRDRYRKVDGEWKICHTTYERVFEIVEENVAAPNYTANLLAARGRRSS